MPTYSADGRAVVVAIDALTAQVRRVADALETPSPTTPDHGPMLAHWTPDLPETPEITAARAAWLAATDEQRADALTTDDDAEEVTMSDAMHAAYRGLGLERHTADSITDPGLTDLYERLEAAERRAEQAEAVTAETKRLLERRTTTLRDRAERAENALNRARAAEEWLRDAASTHGYQPTGWVASAWMALLDALNNRTSSATRCRAQYTNTHNGTATRCTFEAGHGGLHRGGPWTWEEDRAVYPADPDEEQP